MLEVLIISSPWNPRTRIELLLILHKISIVVHLSNNFIVYCCILIPLIVLSPNSSKWGGAILRNPLNLEPFLMFLELRIVRLLIFILEPHRISLFHKFLKLRVSFMYLLLSILKFTIHLMHFKFVCICHIHFIVVIYYFETF